jgi:hypothetical protein
MVVMGIGWSVAAHAGLLDSEPPTLANGQRGTVVYRMGAVHFEPGGWVDTTVTCTNLAAAPADITLEVFDENDRLAGTTARSVAAGSGLTFATSSAVAAAGAAVVPGLPPIDHGKARVSASTTQLTCVAVNRMRGADGAIKEAPLELMKKVAY